VILFFIFMSIVGMLEGMQIAFFAVARMTEEERSRSTWAKKTCDVLFQGEGRNLPGFMIGRQMCVTLCFFIIARVTTVNLEEGDENIFGVSDTTQAFFETGILGALITTIVASIAWQLVASAFPMAFLSTPATYFLLQFCLGLEWTGLCQGSWVVARLHRRIAKFKRDEVYIGTAEERAAKKREALLKEDPEHSPDFEDDDTSYMQVVPGHMYPGVPTLPPDFKLAQRTLSQITDLEQDLKEHLNETERRLAELQAQKKELLPKTDEEDHLEVGGVVNEDGIQQQPSCGGWFGSYW
jgi:hypothetical protein